MRWSVLINAGVEAGGEGEPVGEVTGEHALEPGFGHRDNRQMLVLWLAVVGQQLCGGQRHRHPSTW